jgi:hypothetical protein
MEQPLDDVGAFAPPTPVTTAPTVLISPAPTSVFVNVAIPTGLPLFPLIWTTALK